MKKTVIIIAIFLTAILFYTLTVLKNQESDINVTVQPTEGEITEVANYAEESVLHGYIEGTPSEEEELVDTTIPATKENNTGYGREELEKSELPENITDPLTGTVETTEATIHTTVPTTDVETIPPTTTPATDVETIPPTTTPTIVGEPDMDQLPYIDEGIVGEEEEM